MSSLSDTEIIKALECCANNPNEFVCYEGKCPLFRQKCIDILSKNALDLINRLKVENERLRKALTKSNECLEEGIALAKQTPDMVNKAVTEAVKEFAERLKEEQEFYIDECDRFVGFVAVSRMDNLLKEMG